jgi:hypothetical protein
MYYRTDKGGVIFRFKKKEILETSNAILAISRTALSVNTRETDSARISSTYNTTQSHQAIHEK